MDDHRRIFHLIKGLGRGGAEMLLLQCQRVAQERGEFTYGYGYLLPHKDALVGGLRSNGAEVVCFKAPGAIQLLPAVVQLSRFLRRWQADLVHCHLPVTGVVGRLAGRLSGVPVVYTEHNLQERYHPLTRRLNLASWPLQRRAIAVSQEVLTSIQRRTGSSVPVQVLHNGVCSDHFAPDPDAGLDVRRQLTIPESVPVVGTVAVMRTQKNLADWLRSAQLLLQIQPESHFVLVGDGPLGEELRRLALDLGIGAAVRWVGLQEDVRPYLAAMDVYLMSSDFEGLPVALLEAMSMERPVVSTAVGGIPEVVASDTGILLPPGQPKELAKALSELIQNPERRARMGRQGRVRIQTSFSLRSMVAQLEALYTEVLEAA